MWLVQEKRILIGSLFSPLTEISATVESYTHCYPRVRTRLGRAVGTEDGCVSIDGD